MSISILTFKQIKDGNIQAFETLFRTYYEPLCRYAYPLVEDMETAEEIVQDLFFVIWKERQNLQIFTSVNGYLYRSVKNKSLQYLEQKRVREDYRKAFAENAILETSSPQEELEYKELEQQIKATLEHLPERRQRVFRMHRVEGKKYNEIARELRISVKTVEAEMSKVLRELRKKYNSLQTTNS
jgi:RNA polymerase sigma-70 factor (ECF subfamily)